MASNVLQITLLAVCTVMTSHPLEPYFINLYIQFHLIIIYLKSLLSFLKEYATSLFEDKILIIHERKSSSNIYR